MIVIFITIKKKATTTTTTTTINKKYLTKETSFKKGIFIKAGL